MPFPQCPNYEKNIKAAITFAEKILGALNELKNERSGIFKKELEEIHRDMIQIAGYELVSAQHAAFFEAFPLLIERFSKAINTYFRNITTKIEAEKHRKLFLPILNAMEDKYIFFSVSYELPYYTWRRLEQNDFNRILADLINIFHKLAQQFPTNEEDIFSSEAIPDKRKLTISSGHQFDLVMLLQWQYHRPVRRNGTKSKNKLINCLHKITLNL